MTQHNSDPEQTETKNAGAVDKIRGLLLGEQLAEYDQRLIEIEANLEEKNQQTKKTIDAINTRLKGEQRIRETADILPESMVIAANDGDRLADSMSKPMEGCIRTVIRNDPDQFADALFPVMGPAIRKSINETLKSFLQSMNQVIEQSMSPEALRWRLEAKRCGVPFSEIVLKQTLLYRVDEVFLIQQGSGLVIDYVSHPNVKPRDSDAISAMLTVIKDFTRDSFSGGPGDTLATVEFGERTLWIFEGPKALLACVILGVAPSSAREKFQTILEQVHNEFGSELENFDGNQGNLTTASNLLENCLEEQAREDRQSKNSQGIFSKPATYLLIALLIGSIYLIWKFAAEQHRIEGLTNELDKLPGVVVFDTHQSDGKLIVDGMIDPLMLPLSKIAAKHGFNADEVDFNFSLFQSLEPELAITRAKKLLQPPDSVKFEVNDEQLVAIGESDQRWVDFAAALQNRLPGFSNLDLSGVTLDTASRLRQIQKMLIPPESIQLSLEQDVLTISGRADLTWIEQLRQSKQRLPGVSGIAIGEQGLVAEEWHKVLEIVEKLNGRQLFFDDGIVLQPESDSKTKALIEQLLELNKLSAKVGSKIAIHLTGYTDGTGEADANKSLALARSEAVKSVLLSNGLSNDSIDVEGAQNVSTDGNFDQTLRRVDITISASSPDPISVD